MHKLVFISVFVLSLSAYADDDVDCNKMIPVGNNVFEDPCPLGVKPDKKSSTSVHLNLSTASRSLPVAYASDSRLRTGRWAALTEDDENKTRLMVNEDDGELLLVYPPPTMTVVGPAREAESDMLRYMSTHGIVFDAFVGDTVFRTDGESRVVITNAGTLSYKGGEVATVRDVWVCCVACAILGFVVAMSVRVTRLHIRLYRLLQWRTWFRGQNRQFGRDAGLK